jgi:hypothetical protein
VTVTDRVRRPGERDHLGARAELALQVREVERGVVVQPDVPDHQVPVVRDLQPGGDPGVVIQAGHQISSPGWKARAAVRDSAKFSVVMFGPKITSSGSQPRNRAALCSASSRICPTRMLVA